MLSRRAASIFKSGFLAGLVALLFNFLLRLGGIAPFPPESALNAFLRVVPASIEEPAVDWLGDLAGQLGLMIATLIAAAVYGAGTLAFDRNAAKKVAGAGLGRFESLLVLGALPWAVFGLILFPLDGDSLFGISSSVASATTH